MNALHEPGEEYVGPAHLISEEQEALEVEVQLRGHVEPIDGRFHWYGRIAPNAELDTRHRSGSTVAIRTPHGIAAGRLNDVDPWGRFRIAGLGTPPF
jgi:hypothetical protein